MSGARVMSPRSTVTHRRPQGKHQAKQRGDRARDRRTQIARLSAERDRTTKALTETHACRTEPHTRLTEPQTRLHQLESQRQGLVVHHHVDLLFVALQRLFVARIGLRAVCRVLSRLAWAFGIKQAPCPQTIIHWGMRLRIVRIDSARMLQGLPLRQAPLTNGLLWMLDLRMGLGTGKIWAVLAWDAPHHPRAPGALALAHGRCLGISVAEAWPGDTLADVLQRLMAQMGRPAASLTEGGSARHRAVACLGEQGLRSPCLDDISHAVAGLRTRVSHDHPSFATFLAACGRVSGQRTPTMLACVAPPQVRTKARFLPVHRVCTWADRRRTLSPAGGAKSGATWATLRACLDALPACQALGKRVRADASGLLACQKMLTLKGLSHDTRAQCEPLLDTRPSSA